MTDKTDLIREIHEYVTTHGGENTATHLLVQAAPAIQTQAAELEAVGAGGVQALQPEGGPPGSGGWQHHAETMERERDHAEAQEHEHGVAHGAHATLHVDEPGPVEGLGTQPGARRLHDSGDRRVTRDLERRPHGCGRRPRGPAPHTPGFAALAA